MKNFLEYLELVIDTVYHATDMSKAIARRHVVENLDTVRLNFNAECSIEDTANEIISYPLTF